jgi:hypothetical protein
MILLIGEKSWRLPCRTPKKAKNLANLVVAMAHDLPNPVGLYGLLSSEHGLWEPVSGITRHPQLSSAPGALVRPAVFR